MRKVKLYISTSLDGFIATKEGEIDWLVDPTQPNLANEDYGYYKFYDSIDITLMGYNTYRKILDFGIFFPFPEKTNYVFSRNHTREKDHPVDFISDDITNFTGKLKQNEGKDIWLVGGGQINQLFLNANLIDEMILSIQPVVLGEGLPLFGNGTNFKRFRVDNARNYNGTMAQVYLVRK